MKTFVRYLSLCKMFDNLNTSLYINTYGHSRKKECFVFYIAVAAFFADQTAYISINLSKHMPNLKYRVKIAKNKIL